MKSPCNLLLLKKGVPPQGSVKKKKKTITSCCTWLIDRKQNIKLLQKEISTICMSNVCCSQTTASEM